MLSDEDYRAHARRWGLSPAGQDYVDRTRQSEPSRIVGSGTTRSTPVRFASRRMGMVIQGESDTVEGAFLREWEYDQQNNLEIWDQPPPIPVVITNKRGHRQRTTYTPDYLVLRKLRVEVVECKAPDRVAELVRDRPHDWRYENGVHLYQPVRNYFAELGLSHIVWVPDERIALRSSNIDLLLATRWTQLQNGAASLRRRICKYLAASQAATFAEVVEALELPDLSMILRGIDEGWLYAPLDQYLLSRPHDALIALDRERFEHGSAALTLWRNVAGRDSSVSGDVVPDAARAAVMLQRHQELMGERPPTRSPRSRRRYRAELRNSGNDVRALLPRPRPGNRTSRLTKDEEAIIEESITKHHANPTALSDRQSYLQYLLDFADKQASGSLPENMHAVSLPTYRSRLKKWDQEKIAAARGGVRAANAAAEPVSRDRCSTPPCRPFEIAHADHYLGDRFLLVRTTGKQLWTRKPWISFLRDEGTSEILAMAVGFRTPSRNVLSELMRDCVRRHGRLPQTIISDRGSEFKSVFYETTLAAYGVHKKDRPSAAPRFGGSLERLFGTVKTCILWGRPGSTRNDARDRSVSPSHRGHRLAEQDLTDFYHELEHAVFDQLNAHIRGERLISPDIQRNQGLAMYPMSGVEVAYDESFMIATSIEAPKGSYTADRSRGLKVLGRWFWHPNLARLQKSPVSVRLDPWDEHLVYAYVNGGWISCRSRDSTPHESCDLVAMIARATLRLDARAEQALAQREADLALARTFRERDCARNTPPASAPKADSSECTDHQLDEHLPTFQVLWSE